jgi:hypothetical protein
LNPIYDVTDPVSLVMPRFTFMGQSIGMIGDEDLTEFGVSKAALAAKRSHDYMTYLSPVKKKVGASVFASRDLGSAVGSGLDKAAQSAASGIGKVAGKIAKKVVGG